MPHYPSKMKLTLLALIISTNNFAVSIALGALGQGQKKLRIAGVFASFEFFIPLLGLWLGNNLATKLGSSIGWISPLLLILLGLYTMIDSWKPSSEGFRLGEKATTWKGLALLSLGLSLDNLIVGFSLGVKEYNPINLAALISFFAFIFTLVGIRIGKKSQRNWERPSRIATGALLIFLGIANWLNFI